MEYGVGALVAVAILVGVIAYAVDKERGQELERERQSKEERKRWWESLTAEERAAMKKFIYGDEDDRSTGT